MLPERHGRRGNCYICSEAAFWLLGGKAAGWVPMNLRHEGDSHWFLFNRDTGQILDLTAAQFRTPPPYEKAVARGFLTKQPSKRAQALMDRMLWQDEDD